jgi:glutamate carboxypeptidase
LVSGERLGIRLEEYTAGGASDGNTTSQYTATLDGLGAIGDGAHARHESVSIAGMSERAALLAELLMAPVEGTSS